MITILRKNILIEILTDILTDRYNNNTRDRFFNSTITDIITVRYHEIVGYQYLPIDTDKTY